ncbi:type I-E CRISPR-associated protein Cse2/CasB [Streptomyces sp. ISL-44]|uniref:type I-E CRISPR-associated protein Cse2/CasB n=1 Tax=Streptomyces sp. ISL-44 TaxID=2819184 RepID=UPI001BE756B2|nr:type I-E CRISPR-associated protein Cse2/CasB [Streptomyces sp. ISL-44]MBT2544987.1 type I-E CRISPR-associated protein Cse2/CasB [Streptomyces sp. ISL-44]
MTDTAPRIPAPLGSSAPRHGVDKPFGPLRHAVTGHIRTLQNDYRADRSHAVQALARLRRGVGRQATELPDLWGLVGIEQFHEAYFAQRQVPVGEEAALRAERAAHVAVTLWALHQQSNRAKPMHVSGGPSMGAAVRGLMSGTDSDEPIRKRLVRAGTATTLDVMAQRLRDLVVLLRAAEVPLDYGLLAEQLDQWQRPGGPSQVRQAWGRSFHAYRASAPDTAKDGAVPVAQPETAANEMKEDE